MKLVIIMINKHERSVIKLKLNYSFAITNKGITRYVFIKNFTFSTDILHVSILLTILLEAASVKFFMHHFTVVTFLDVAIIKSHVIKINMVFVFAKLVLKKSCPIH